MIRFFPTHVIPLIILVHLLLACSLAAPLLDMAQMNRNPSFGVPRVARYLPSGLNTTAVTPNVCSLSMTSGTSEDSWRLNIKTRGVYPVSPTARKRPSLLSERQVAAFIRSLLVHVFDRGESLQVFFELFGVEGAMPTEDSLKKLTVLFRPSFAFIGVAGFVDTWLAGRFCTALG